MSFRKDYYNIQRNYHLVPFLDVALTCLSPAVANEKDVDIHFVDSLYRINYVENIPKKINVAQKVRLPPPGLHSI